MTFCINLLDRGPNTGAPTRSAPNEIVVVDLVAVNEKMLSHLISVSADRLHLLLLAVLVPATAQSVWQFQSFRAGSVFPLQAEAVDPGQEGPPPQAAAQIGFYLGPSSPQTTSNDQRSAASVKFKVFTVNSPCGLLLLPSVGQSWYCIGSLLNVINESLFMCITTQWVLVKSQQFTCFVPRCFKFIFASSV